MSASIGGCMCAYLARHDSYKNRLFFFFDKFWEIVGGQGRGDIADTNERQMKAIQ